MMKHKKLITSLLSINLLITPYVLNASLNPQEENEERVSPKVTIIYPEGMGPSSSSTPSTSRNKGKGKEKEVAEEKFYASASKIVLKKAAFQGNAIAKDYLAVMYANEKKDVKALELFKESAAQGYASAQNHLGVMYLNQEKYTEALNWLTKSAAQGNLKAQVNIGVAYYNQDQYDKALKCFRRCADKGIVYGQYHLGIMYDNGPHHRGKDYSLPQVLNNRREAAKWYRCAAEQGCSPAQSKLGGCYLVGEGVDQSFEEALRWCTLAADQGGALDQYYVGLMHAKGFGVEQSYEEGLKWCRLAAEQGHSEARTMLGWTDENNQGLDQSPEEALKLFSIAIARQKVEGQESLDMYYQFLRSFCSHEEAMEKVSHPVVILYLLIDTEIVRLKMSWIDYLGSQIGPAFYNKGHFDSA